MEIFEHLKFNTNQIITGIVALGLIIDGIIKKLGKRGPDRGCLYGDEAHEELKEGIAEHIKEIAACKSELSAIKGEVGVVHDLMIEAVAIIRNRRD